MTHSPLRSRLRRTGRRLLWFGGTAALTWGLVAAALMALAGAWLDLLWELSPQARIAAVVVAAMAGVLLVAALVRRAALAARHAAVARRLDRAAGCGGDILTGLELDMSLSAGVERGGFTRRCVKGDSPIFVDTKIGTVPAGISAGLGQMAVEHAAALAGRVKVSKAVPARPLGRSLASLLFLAAGVGLVGVLMPGLARTQWGRFTRPFDDIPPYSATTFTVTPGDIQVVYGSELGIRAVTRGAALEQAELVLEDGLGQQTSLPMFPERDGSWQAVLSKVTEPAVYYVRSYRSRSIRYQLGVITVPRIENVRLRIAPPEYANQAAYEGPLPKEGVAGLPGAVVTLWATSNRPLGGGTLTVSGTKAARPLEVKMQPSGEESQEVTGRFTIRGDGRFECRVIDQAGQPSQQTFAGSVTMLADQYPFIRILQPPPVSLATPTAQIPVLLSAEDDCGVTRVELFRSLNESRPLPAMLLPVGRPPRRYEPTVALPLAGYGLEPGDVIKLFGRVEDNDPAGAKGSESPVVTLRIISQEEFERMVRAREGLEVLLAKYREAQRRMEGLADKMDGLRKKLKKQPPGSLAAKEMRQELGKLQRLLRAESKSLREAAAHNLPYDIDQKLSSEISSLANMTDAMARELEKLEKQTDLLNDNLAKRLAEMKNRLAGNRHRFDQRAMQPLEFLEAVFPLLVDQDRFAVLVLRQQDLAERLASLKGHDGEDNPALKGRMRDLEHEQRLLREELGALLDDIEEHVARLPDEPKLKKLRETATKFVKDVRASGAAGAMADAETALAEFSGARGHAKAKQAADILEKFLKRCNSPGGMGAEGEGCLAFQPMLCNVLGNSVAQLLADMGGMGNMGGGGQGMGMGSGSSNVGLYGGLEGLGGWGEGRFHEGQSASGQGGAGQGAAGRPGRNPDVPGPDDATAAGAAAGSSQGTIPIRYRRQVGQYLQRLAEESQ